MVANISHADRPQIAPSPRPTLEVNGQNHFMDHGHVAYQIEGNHKFNNMVVKISLQSSPSPDPK